MAFTDMLANGVASVTGEIAKATIKIKDDREDWEDANIQMQEAVKTGGNALDAMGGIGSMVSGGMSGSALSGVTNKVTSKLDSVTGGALGLNKVNKLADSMNDGYNKVFEVQFNPASLSISGYNQDGSMASYDLSLSRVNKQTTGHVNMSMSVKLIFNQVDLNACFPADSINMSTSNAINTAVKVGKKAIGATGPSIQVIVEGFIAALRNENTRMVAFEWGDLFYEGMMRSVSTKYTIFDTAGHPMAAEVMLSIYLRDDDVMAKNGKLNLGYWQAAYDDAFSSSASYISVAQKVVSKISKAMGG